MVTARYRELLHRLIAPSRAALQYTLRFAFPWACAGCRTPLTTLDDQGFCGTCWIAIPRIQGLVCESCGLPLPMGGSLCYSCDTSPSAVPIRAAIAFKGPARKAIHRFKFASRGSLAHPLSLLMYWALDRYPALGAADALVPIPGHPTHLRRRGFHPATLLASALGQRIGLPVLDGLLIRDGSSKPQAQLSKPERIAAARSAYGIADIDLTTLRGKRFLLIDDVCTTSSTFRSCGALLRKNGAKSVMALALAREL